MRVGTYAVHIPTGTKGWVKDIAALASTEDNIIRIDSTWFPAPECQWYSPYRDEVVSFVQRLRDHGFHHLLAYDGESQPEKHAIVETVLSVDQSAISAITPERNTRVNFDIMLGNPPGELVYDHSAHPLASRVVWEHETLWST